MTGDTSEESETIPGFLERLGARTPTPAGGSVAALCAAQAAALVSMVARYCEAPGLADRAERLVTQAHELMAADERAFGRVAETWTIPRDSSSQHAADETRSRESRQAAIDDALLAASEPQARVAETALEVLILIDELRPSARPGLASDLVAAAEVARTASAIARMNVESNLHNLPDTDRRSAVLRSLGMKDTTGERD